MKSAFKKVKSTIRKIALLIMPIFFWFVFSIKRLFSNKRCLGFITDEFFSKDFIDKRICDIGGFGMTATVISKYYHHAQKRNFEAVTVLSKILPSIC